MTLRTPFDLRKPYYNLDASGRFDLLGHVVNLFADLKAACLLATNMRHLSATPKIVQPGFGGASLQPIVIIGDGL